MGSDVQQINAADVKNDDEMEQKTVMAKLMISPVCDESDTDH